MNRLYPIYTWIHRKNLAAAALPDRASIDTRPQTNNTLTTAVPSQPKTSVLSRPSAKPNHSPVNPGAIVRVTYSIAGQTVATRVTGDPDPANNGLFYIYSDHLGSANTAADTSNNIVNDVRFYPFGGLRSGSINDNITDRGFTGHRENREIGLTYMNARYYLPGVGRFVTADTIVPDPVRPQSFNRYSYVLNSPLKYTDPDGHKECEYANDCSPPPSLPSWWTDADTTRVAVMDYGLFDIKHIRRGYRSGLFFMEQLDAAISNGGGNLPVPPSSAGNLLWGDYIVDYWVSGDISDDQIMGVLFGMYMDFEYGYETNQGQRPDLFSSFAPEDLPSDYIGFWAAVNGYSIDAVPYILENLGNVTPYPFGGDMGQIVFDFWVEGQIPYSIPRNYEFTPMSPQVNEGIGPFSFTTMNWGNVAWPSYLHVTPIRSSNNTWARID